MHKSDFLSLKISGNAALGFMLQGYMLAYLNPALSTIDVVFNFEEDQVNFYNGLLSAIISVGAGTGSYLAQYLFNFFSLKNAMIFTDIVTCIACLLSITGNLNLLIFGRFIIGFMGGAQSILVPIYLSAFTPEPLKGLNSTFVGGLASIGVGIAFVLGFNFSNTPSADNQYWKFVFAYPIIFCGIRSFVLYKIYPYETPQYYLQQNEVDKAREAIAFIYKEEFVEKQLEIVRNIETPKDNITFNVLTTRYKIRFQKGIVQALLMQLAGIGCLLSYSTIIFNQATDNNRLYTNLLNLLIPINGLANAILAGYLPKYYTYKQIFQYGILGCCVPMFILTVLTLYPDSNQVIVIILIFTFQAFYSLSFGSCSWMEIASLVPAKGISICALIAWYSSALVGQTFPLIMEALTISGCFFCFGIFGFLGFLYFVYEYDKQDYEEGNKNLIEVELTQK